MLIRAFYKGIYSITWYSLGGVPHVPKTVGKGLEPYLSYVFVRCRQPYTMYIPADIYVPVGYVYVLAYPTRVGLGVTSNLIVTLDN